MDLKLKDKTALVTGSTAGIGYAIAQSLAAEGAKVIVTGRTEERVNAAIEKIKSQTGNSNISGSVADFGKVLQVNALIRQHTDVNILVNNVGIAEPKDFKDITDDDWMHIYEVNVLSGRAAFAGLFRQYDKEQLGPHHFYFKRIGCPDSTGNDPIWRLQDRPDISVPWSCRVNCRYGGYCKHRFAGADID